MIREYLASHVAAWERMGHPDLLERFVLRNGKEFKPGKRKGHKRRAKECFSNAVRSMERYGGTYVEGFAIAKDMPIIAFNHAWVTYDGETAMDPTLDAAEYEYLGIPFGHDVLWRELRKNKVYGLLDTGVRLNHELMFEIDPELKGICETIKNEGSKLHG